jgi:hypothetical protein
MRLEHFQTAACFAPGPLKARFAMIFLQECGSAQAFDRGPFLATTSAVDVGCLKIALTFKREDLQQSQESNGMAKK